MSSTPKEVSYLDWAPVIKPEEVFQQSVGFMYLSLDESGRLFWVENRPEESGRSVLVMKTEDGKIQDVIPKPFSTRSRVFEYGGYPYIASQNWVYFVNLPDQKIYKMNLLALDKPPVAVTIDKNTDGSLGKYVDLTVSPNGRWLLFAYEKEKAKSEAKNELGLIDLQGALPQEAKTIVTGADFYKSPHFSPDGKKIAWLEWNHPYMPWDSTLLIEAPFAGDSTPLQSKNHIAGSKESSIAQFCYTSKGEIIFAADFAHEPEDSPKNFYNLNAFRNGKIQTLTQERSDFQQFRCSGETVFAMMIKEGVSQLSVFDSAAKKLKTLPMEAVDFSVPIPFGDKIYLVGVLAKAPMRLLELNLEGKSTVIKKSSSSDVDERNVSDAVAISYPTEDGKKSYGYFYPPVNSNYKAPQNEKPPVRVLVHGGPIGMTSPGFQKQKLFWTSQGYAIFDVNYRGSVGFGRAYRDALKKKWGLLEIQDVKDGLAYLTKQGYISGQAVVSGGSAGGYSVQRLLTFYPDLFAAGASHFGIGNLVTLQKLTHKYESHFLEQLIGGTLKTNLKEYQDRSPINHLEKIKSPMIIFQGSDDKVVPPENSREMAAILEKKGVRHEYYEYPGEDHGFRKKENLVDSLQKEAAFFKSVLKPAAK